MGSRRLTDSEWQQNSSVRFNYRTQAAWACGHVLLSAVLLIDANLQCSTHQLRALDPEYRRKDQKKVDKLTAQIPYHEGRGNKDEVTKIKEQVEAIWQKARDAQFA